MRRIGENVRFFRNLRGLTQTSLARLVQVAPAYISQIEANQRVPSLKVTRRIADVLELDMSVLLRESDASLPEGRLTHSQKLDLLRTLMMSLEAERGAPATESKMIRTPSVDWIELASEPSFCVVLRVFHESAPFGRETSESAMEWHLVLEGSFAWESGDDSEAFAMGRSVTLSGEEGERLIAARGSRVLSVYGPRLDLTRIEGFVSLRDEAER